MSQTGLPAKRYRGSGLILSCFSFLNPCRMPVQARQNQTFCPSHTFSSHRAKLIPCWAALPPAPGPYKQIQFKVQPTLLETVTEVKKAEQE